MSKFKRVLSDDELQTIAEELMWSSGESIGFGIDVANAVQDAVLTKPAEQEPVAWTSAEIMSGPSFVDDDDYAVMYKTKSHLLDDFCGYPEATPVPLYAHPIPSCQGILNNSNHIPDTGKMVRENCQYLPDGSSLVDEVKVMVEMLEDKEWAEHIGKTGLGSRLERAVSALHNELLEVQGRHIFIDGGSVPDGWQLAPKEPTDGMIEAAMEASLLGRPSLDDETYVMSIIDAYLKAAPKYKGDAKDESRQ